MADRSEPHADDAFAAETRRVTARRTGLGLGFMLGLAAVAGLLELAFYPDRLGKLAAAFGADARVNYRRLSAPLINDERMSTLMRDVAAELVGASNVRHGVRTMGGEDMAFFLESVPGCFAFVGSATKGGTASPHHSPTFDIDEESLVVGAELLTRTAIRYLEAHS